MASPTRWTWVWVNSRSWWWTRRPGMLRFMGLQRVRYGWAIELNWTECMFQYYPFLTLGVCRFSPQKIILIWFHWDRFIHFWSPWWVSFCVLFSSFICPCEWFSSPCLVLVTVRLLIRLPGCSSGEGVILVRMLAVKGRPLEWAGTAHRSDLGLLPGLCLVSTCRRIIYHWATKEAPQCCCSGS